MKKSQMGLQILVVEDNPGDYVLIEEYLQEEYSVVECCWVKGVSEAKNMLCSERAFDAVLLDLSLPDAKDTDLLVEEMVKLAKNTPVIVLTGFARKEYGIDTLAKGVSDYLFKDELTASGLCKSIDYSIERKRIHLKMEESEDKYRTIFKANPMPMWVLDRKSLKFLSVNKAAIEMYGYSKEEFLNMSIRDLWCEDTRPKAEKIVDENLHEEFRIEVNHFKKNGECIHVDVQSSPITYSGREARVTLAHDITARREAEAKLLQSEQRFKSLVQESSDIISILDHNFVYQYQSPAVEKILAIPAEKFLGRNAFDFIHPDDTPKLLKLAPVLREKKRLQLPSFRFKDGQGNWRWIETMATDLTGDPAIGGIIANSRDITEFVKQEQKLMDSVKRYETVSKATSDLITDYDVERDIMVYSDALFEMFGYSEKEVENSGAWWNERVHPEDRETVQYRVNGFYRIGSKNLQIEYRFRCADGSYKHILDRSYLITDKHGIPKRVIGSMQDITERKNYVKAIECSNKRLKEIAWTQSHVVRAPLAKVMGLVDLLKNHRDNLDDVDEILENILSSSEELDAIIRKIATKTEETDI
ncbi:MAG: PAS domain S-box protein [Salegentibacter sp.]